ncbi:MAG: alanine--glyoxylate aminotransferase family protein [Haloferacaceae archaeon]
MDEDFLLLNPGPVPVSDAVLASMTEPMVSHRSAAFEDVYERAQDGLEYVFTRSSVTGEPTAEGGETLIFNGTATMAMEAAVANLVSGVGRASDAEVVALVNGKFGRRFARIAERYADCTRVEVEWGESIPLDDVADAVSDDTDVVTMVHNETSTGLLNPVAGVGVLANEHDAAFIVDGVTSVGGDTFHIDDWHVDVAITDAQKALAAPPGTSAMYATPRAVERFDGERAPFYEDLDWHVRKADQHQTPFTSAIPLFRALATAVEEIRAEGIPDRIARHRRQAAAVRDGVTAMGLDLFPAPTGETEYSNTLTAVALPEAVRGDDADAFFDAVAERNVSVAGGQAHLGGDIFRLSNMGELTAAQVLRGVRTVGEAMRDAGVDVAVPTGVEAARERLGAAADGD